MKMEMNDTSMESIKTEPQIMIGGGGEAVIVSSQPPPQQPQPNAPQIQQQSVTGGYQQQHGHGQHHHGGMSQDCTIWMGDLSPDWEESFIREAFGQYSKDIRHVKLVTTQTELGQKRATYCFVEFHDEESARTAILDVNGNPFANDRSYRFNLAFANSPNQMQVEYNLFVNNLAPDVDDVALFRLFGVKYRSCRGAKVYKDEEGRSKEQGFVRFISETDQQRALVEMNKQSFRGRELFLKLARPKTRGTGRYGHGRGGGMGGGHGSHLGGYNQYHGAGIMAGQLPVQMQMLSAGMQYMPGMVPVAPIAVATPYGTQLAPNHGMAGFGTGAALPLPQQQFAGQPYIVGGQSYHQQGGGGYIQSQFPHSIHPGPMVNLMPPMAVPSYQQIVPATQFTQPKQPAVPVYEDVEPLSAEEHNAILLNSNNEFSTALEASRWGPTAFPPDTRKKELPNYLTQQLN